MAANGKPLRVGVISPDARLVVDRVVPAGEPVTVGTDPSCFVAFEGPGVPERFALIVWSHGAWRLRFDDRVGLRVGLGPDEPPARVPLTGLGLIERGLATRDDDGAWTVPLDEAARGQVNVGAWRVLFKFAFPDDEV